jgi:hypothetical protein
MPVTSKQPLGVIFDTNSSGRFDLLIYDDGLLAVRGNYVGVALLGAGAGLGGAVGGLAGGGIVGAGAAVGHTRPKGYRGKRIAKLLQRSRQELLEEHGVNFFLALTAMSGVVLRKRWHGCALTISTEAAPVEERVFTWKPALNNFGYVRELAGTAFGDLLSIE